MTKLKLCGLSRREDILCANRLLPDYVGFVFAPSKRQVDIPRAKALRSLLDTRIKAVGVFVNEDPAAVAALCNQGIIDIAQLHGDEDEDYLRRLIARTDAPLIQAVRVAGALPPLPRGADYLLFDTLSAAARGGTGEAFPWALLSGCKRPYFLAGGLHSGNVRSAIRALGPYCVDVSSGVETGGRKDPEKMEEITGIIRSVS